MSFWYHIIHSPFFPKQNPFCQKQWWQVRITPTQVKRCHTYTTQKWDDKISNEKPHFGFVVELSIYLLILRGNQIELWVSHHLSFILVFVSKVEIIFGVGWKKNNNVHVSLKGTVKRTLINNHRVGGCIAWHCKAEIRIFFFFKNFFFFQKFYAVWDMWILDPL